MIIYDNDSNEILLEALNINGAAEQLASTTKPHTHLKNRGIDPKFYIMATGDPQQSNNKYTAIKLKSNSSHQKCIKPMNNKSQ